MSKLYKQRVVCQFSKCTFITLLQRLYGSKRDNNNEWIIRTNRYCMNCTRTLFYPILSICTPFTPFYGACLPLFQFAVIWGPHSVIQCTAVNVTSIINYLNMRGCPQGGVLSPLLWNLVVDRLLTVTNDLGFSTLGYADDIVIIVQGKFANTGRELMQSALNMVAEWAVKEGLNISPQNTAIVPFTNRRKIEGLRPLKLHGKELKMLDEVKYLGVI
jgi:hypothetical protein